MSTCRIGSLCTGYGGLDLAVMEVLGGNLAWCADNDPHVSAILAARFPVPNLGDIANADWASAPAVLEPDLIVVENVAALAWPGRGMGRVLGDLAAAGYDAAWCRLRASDVDAPHPRERVFIAAHPAGPRPPRRPAA